MLEVIVPVRTRSTLNLREHWSVTTERTREHRFTTRWALRARFGLATGLFTTPLTITLVRVGPKLLDSDNLQGALKAVRDGVADWLGIDDGDDGLTWVCAQEQPAKLGSYAVRVRIENQVETG